MDILFVQQEMLDCFREEFNRIKPESGKAYNQNRRKGMPTWLAVSNACSDGTWRGLVEKAGVDSSCLRYGGARGTIRLRQRIEADVAQKRTLERKCTNNFKALGIHRPETNHV